MISDEDGTPTDYRLLVRRLGDRAAELRQPINGTFELTERCNLACRMCYVRQAPGDDTSRAGELSAVQWLDIARQAIDRGMLFLLLTGGEVFLRPDFFEILTPLTRMGLVITLFSNGTFITKTVAARLAEAPPSRTEITIYGATQATYEKITGVSGSFKRCIAGIEALVEQQVPLGLKTTLTQYNVHELEAMRRLSHDWGLPFMAAWLLSRRRDGARSEVEDSRLPPSACVELEAADRASASDWAEAGRRGIAKPDDNNFYCRVGRAAFTITTRGEMIACPDLPLPAERPLDIGFDAAWEKLQQFVDAAPPLAPICAACDVRSFCPRCPAWSKLEAGTLTDPVPYLCDIAVARKERFGKTA